MPVNGGDCYPGTVTSSGLESLSLVLYGDAPIKTRNISQKETK